jgi:hypothetical protein
VQTKHAAQPQREPDNGTEQIRLRVGERRRFWPATPDLTAVGTHAEFRAVGVLEDEAFRQLSHDQVVERILDVRRAIAHRRVVE